MTDTPDPRRRWDTDDQFTGATDASGFTAAADELVTLARLLNVAAEHQPDASRRDIRKQAWTLIGTVAETLASVREHVTDDGVVFEVVTGVPPGGHFATHGHTLRLTVHPPQGSRDPG